MDANRLTSLRGDLTAFLEGMTADLGRADRRRWALAYVRGLLLDGDRKSAGAMAERLAAIDRATRDYEQGLQQLLADSPWADRPVRDRLARWAAGRSGRGERVVVVDDTGFPKKGTHSVGVAPQYLLGVARGGRQLPGGGHGAAGGGRLGGLPGRRAVPPAGVGRRPGPVRRGRGAGGGRVSAEVADRPGSDGPDGGQRGHRHRPGRRRLRVGRQVPGRGGGPGVDLRGRGPPGGGGDRGGRGPRPGPAVAGDGDPAASAGQDPPPAGPGDGGPAVGGRAGRGLPPGDVAGRDQGAAVGPARGVAGAPGRGGVEPAGARGRVRAAGRGAPRRGG